jgi:hemolysin activation/secretion protein
MLHGVIRSLLLTTLLLGGTGGRAAAQSIADRGDASLIREQAGREPAPLREIASVRPLDPTPRALAANVDGITVGAVHVEGAMAVPASAFAAAIQPYLGRELGEGELRTLASDVAAVARQRGYGLASARVPRQRLTNGVLRVQLDEGMIDAVEVTGDGAGAVQPLLNRLISGRPVKTAELERQLLLAGDAAGVSTQGARIEERLGQRVLLLQALRRRTEGRVSTDNWGSRVVGPVVGTVSFDVNGVTGFRDRLSLSASLTAQAPEYQFASATYTLPIASRGTEVAVSGYYGHLRPGADLRESDLEGDSAELRLGLTHPLLRSRSTSLWASFDAVLRNSDVDRSGLPDRRDRIRAASLGVGGLAAVGGGRLRARITLVQGLPVLGATEEGTALASRADGSAIFTKIEAYAYFQRALGRRFSLAAAMTGQLSARPLLSSMEMGLGGRSFLRAFDYREVSGDSGAAAYVESRFDLGKLFGGIVGKTQIYAYADGGRVRNLRAGRGGGALASAGGGVRLSLFSGTDASFEVGVPLTDSPYNRSPKPRFSFAFSRAF